MNATKILSFIVLGLFLVSTASALIGVNGRWEDYSKDIQIDKGQSVQFDVYFMTYGDNPMDVAVRLYSVSDSGEKLVHTFIDSSITNDIFGHTYLLDKGIYKTDGEFKIILSGSDSDDDSDETILNLKVKPISDDDNNDKDEETNKQRYVSEDEFDKEKYLKQFEPKTIPTEDTQETPGTPSNSWIIWLIVGLIVLVVLIIVISSLRG